MVILSAVSRHRRDKPAGSQKADRRLLTAILLANIMRTP
jgi:hypothetical protein